MEKITQLVRSLSKREVRLFYKYAALSGKNKYNLKIQLFNFLLEKTEISDEIVAKSLNIKSAASLSMLKNRLQTDIMKLLVFSGEESRFFSKVLRARYQVNKKLAECYILDNRNLKALSFESARRAELIATKYDLATAKVAINEFLLNSFPMRGPKIFKNIKAKTDAELNNQMDHIKAQDLAKQLTSFVNFEANKIKSKQELGRKAVAELEELVKQNPSDRIKFYYYRSKITYTEDIQDFKTYYETCLTFLDLIKSSPRVNSSDNLGGSYMMLAAGSMHLGHFGDAINQCEIGAPYFFKDSNNDINLKSILFHAYLGAGKIQEAIELIEKLRSIKSIKRGSLHYYKLLYYDANIKFLQGNYSGCMSFLKRHSFLKADKSGWRLGYKVLEMMCIIEMQNYDWLPYRLETFRKLLSDIKTENTARPKLINKLLKRLIKENFNFDKTTEKLQAEFDLLRSNTGEYYCYPIGYEVIRFDEWWASKLSKRQGGESGKKPKRRTARLKDD